MRSRQWTSLLTTSLWSRALSLSSNNVQFVGKHRTLRVAAAKDKGLPPLVLLGGTAQTINSWVGHYAGLSRERDLWIVELRGQGQENQHLPVSDVSLQVQASDLKEFFREAGISVPLTLAGFSFGARVALKYAAANPHDVEAVSVTSVAGKRGAYGRVVLRHWASLLEEGDDLKPYAWSSILSTHSPAFIEKNEKRVESWVSLVAQANTRAGLRAIVTQTHGGDVFPEGGGTLPSDDADDPLELAKACRASGVRGQIITGGKDVICDLDSVPALAEASGFEERCFVDCAHAVPLEAPLEWRKEVLRFLDAGAGVAAN